MGRIFVNIAAFAGQVRHHHRAADLQEHPFISYVDDLAFSSELLYLANVVPGASATLRSTLQGVDTPQQFSQREAQLRAELSHRLPLYETPRVPDAILRLALPSPLRRLFDYRAPACVLPRRS